MLFELRLAWRDIRPSLRKFIFMVTAIALGVGSLTGIKGFSQALDRAMSRSARDLIAADLAVRMNFSPNKEELAVFDSLTRRGCETTRVTETLSMASSAKASRPLLSNIKAVDPRLYPFYGSVELDPILPLNKLLADDAVVVSQDFLIRTNSAIGDFIQIGAGHFRIAAVLQSEPDRLASGVDLGPRILITRDGLTRSGLIQFGSRLSESFLFRLPSQGLGLEEAEQVLKAGLQRHAHIADIAILIPRWRAGWPGWPVFSASSACSPSSSAAWAWQRRFTPICSRGSTASRS
jgi:putative ABC transport system permease protein